MLLSRCALRIPKCVGSLPDCGSLRPCSPHRGARRLPCPVCLAPFLPACLPSVILVPRTQWRVAAAEWCSSALCPTSLHLLPPCFPRPTPAAPLQLKILLPRSMQADLSSPLSSLLSPPSPFVPFRCANSLGSRRLRRMSRFFQGPFVCGPCPCLFLTSRAVQPKGTPLTVSPA